MLYKGLYIRYTLIFVLIISVNRKTYSCSCAGQSFCNHINSEYFEDGVIWIGEFITSQQIGNRYTAYQFRVIELLKGKLATGDFLWMDAPFDPWAYKNTESTIWVFGSLGDSCSEHYPDAKIIFATLFDNSVTGSGELGYATSLCITDFLTVREDDHIVDFIDNLERTSSYTLEEMREIVATGCGNLVSKTSDLDRAIFPAFNLYPNPTNGIVSVESPSYEPSDCAIEVYSVNGQRIWQRSALFIDLENANDGIYVVSFQCAGMKYVKRILKIST